MAAEAWPESVRAKGEGEGEAQAKYAAEEEERGDACAPLLAEKREEALSTADRDVAWWRCVLLR